MQRLQRSAASDDSTLTLMTLVTRLAVLAEAVAELRLAQRRAAQAAAARRAAEHLHAATDSVTSRPGEFLRTRPQTAAQTARLDAPVPLRLLSQQRSTPSAAQPAPCGSAGHTRDLHRQDQLMACYTIGRSVPTVIWDKDLQLPLQHLLRLLPNVAVCEAALLPRQGAASLLFPVRDTDLDTADPATLAAESRELPLAYAGNQYDRDEEFGAFSAPAATRFAHRVAGKWTRIDAWPHVNFTGRCPFPEVNLLYRIALATAMLLPSRYARAGPMTQRLPEAVLAGCLPITPAHIACAALYTPTGPSRRRRTAGHRTHRAGHGHHGHGRARRADRCLPRSPVRLPAVTPDDCLESDSRES